MATSGTINGTTSNEYIDSKIEWSCTSSIADNTSTVTAKLYYRRNNTGYTTYGTGSFSITIDGDKKTVSDTLTIGTEWVLAMTHSAVVDHNDDGTKSLTISATGSISGTSLSSTTCSDTVTLNTIARVSEPTLSASSVQMKNSVTIYTNRKASSFTHTLTYSFGGVTGTIANDVGASYKWTVPDLASKISGETSETCTITCKTYSGSTLVGSKTVKLTLTIPDKSTPTVSDTSVQMGKSVTLYTNRNSSGFTHTLSYTVGSKSGTIDTDVTTSKSWTVPKSLAAYTESKTSVTCTITCKTYTGSTLVGTDTTTMTLTVPDETVPTLSASSVALGNDITISLPRETSAYEHDITMSLKASGSSTVAHSATVAAGATTSYTWTVPLSYAGKIPAATKGTVTLTVVTRFADSTTEIGSRQISFTVTVPENSTTKPEVSMEVSPYHSLPAAFDGLYIQGKSRVKSVITASSAYSTIESYEQTVSNTKSSSESTITSDVLSTKGSITVKGTAVDARGFDNADSETITVIVYGKPKVLPAADEDKIICARCDKEGNLTDSGTYLKIKCRRSYSTVISGDVQKNFCTLRYRCVPEGTKFSGDEGWVPLLEGSDTSTNTVDADPIAGVVSSAQTGYIVQVGVIDDIGETAAIQFIIPTDFTTIDIPEKYKGKRIGIFRYVGNTDEDGVYVDLPIFGGSVDSLKLGSIITATAEAPISLNDIKTPGCYYSPNADSSQYMSDTPYTAGGFGLEVRELQSVNMLRQTLYYGRTTWVRHWNMEEWSAWLRLLVTSQGESYATDFVVEEGTSEGWTYKKWKSRTYQMFGKFDVTPTESTQHTVLYRTNSISLPIPFAVTSAYVSGVIMGYGFLSNGGISSEIDPGIAFRMISDEAFSTTTATEVRLSVVGTY